MSVDQKRILIIGGNAGGASCAARSRRLSETAEIIVFEQGSFVSFANCGLPYYIGDVITDEKKLLVANVALFRDRFNIDVRLECEVMAINREAMQITVKNRQTGAIYQESYDALVLATGAAPIIPPLAGIDLTGIFVVRTIPDSRQIRTWIADHQAKRAVVVGGGFIGLEMAENLVNRGIEVTLIESQSQVMSPLDPEMVVSVQETIRSHHVNLVLGDSVSKFKRNDHGIAVTTKSGATHTADIVILGIGVRPETALAKAAGLEIGDRGGIRVNEQMQTSDRKIWAVGDAVEVKDFVTGEWTLIPLAGPANRQGRIAADVICEACPSTFRGVQGTSVCGAFGLTIASTGVNEKTLKRLDWEYEKVYLHPIHHAGYYPDAKPIDLKLLFSKEDGRILGAQAVGEEGVEKRIDAIAIAMQMGATVFDLKEAELCYAPQFGSAKDPINMAGMIAANVLRGDATLVHWEQLSNLDGRLLLDVRNVDEFEAGNVQGAVNIPLPQLRDRLNELNPEQEIWVYCQVGQRGYYATRMLSLNGFKAYNLSGGFKTFQAVKQTS
ncbi:FAD-dependent oxidoreductase [Pseudanabaena galeata UHCC 0370]|uniref:FAD-dependent oxidoreductase n=1 Tax=Pseudanabaena galeata UHCC 0370 TaxID=3110310 RepID=A0ABU5TQC8_9CYAN|nr:FAD-dependent oxidoreductase [Pseudanabaena galeata]MEA5480246.1 FAD-dependent oxidoreductase [Pseudanabaena galeata UHCC 0370]